MSSIFGTSIPGVRTDRQHDPREFLVTEDLVGYLPQGKVISATASRDAGNSPDVVTLRPGLIMGRITTGGKYAPSFFGLTTVAVTAGQGVVTVGVATATEIVRRVSATGTIGIVGAPTTAGTVVTTAITLTAVNTTTGVLTISPTLAAAYVAGSLLRASDGSETPEGVLNSWRRVTDVDGVEIDAALDRLVVTGFVDIEQLIPAVSATNSTLRTWLKGQLNAPSTGPGPFRFFDNF